MLLGGERVLADQLGRHGSHHGRVEAGGAEALAPAGGAVLRHDLDEAGRSRMSVALKLQANGWESFASSTWARTSAMRMESLRAGDRLC